LAELIRHTPLYSTWDDHDYGLDGSDGTLPDKEFSRKAFTTYRANPGFGENEAGIYSRFRKGPVEVFLLDTRWFSGTEPSPVDTNRTTLLGKKQYYWLLRALLNSNAEFKILASGMIWNDAVRPNKPDYWGKYSYERDSLFAFIGRNNISGVVLVGGDIHRSRLVMHQSEELAGYQIPELISSPLHEGIIENANADHPGLLFDMGEANAYLVVEVSNEGMPYLEGNFYTADGKLHYRQRFDLEELSQ
jgi:alkaline phosphatase D